MCSRNISHKSDWGFIVFLFSAIGIFSVNQKVLRHIITKTCPCNKITKTCPCNIQRTFLALKIKKIIGKIWLIKICLLKTLIVEAVLMSTHNLCFGTKIRRKKIEYRSTHANPSLFVFYINVGVKGGCINFTDTLTCFLVLTMFLHFVHILSIHCQLITSKVVA